ncbi:cadherin-like domain-containing protein, partial [Candidatus Parcubacteria bacterium]|nr:cadherin-like domain-containing protein [Candidatus Parcubacteria bacterium]
PVVIDVLHDDIDAENNIDPSSVTVSSAPSHGATVVNSDGTITYTPNQDYVGSDTFTYNVCDLDNACSQAEATVTVETIKGEVTTNITAGQDFAETNEDTPITIAALDNDIDAGGGTLHIDSILVNALHGAAEIDGSTIVYTPSPDYFGTDSFTYLVCDNQSAPVCVESPPVSITIIPVNDAPIANDDFVIVGENDSVIIHASHDDYDVERNINPHSVAIMSSPENGIAVVNDGDTITYTPNIDFSGTDKITYQICDFDNACDTADITVTILAVDHSPVTANDTLFVFTNKSGTVDVLANDASSAGDLYAGSIVSPPDHGTEVINQDNTITYTPA